MGMFTKNSHIVFKGKLKGDRNRYCDWLARGGAEGEGVGFRSIPEGIILVVLIFIASISLSPLLSLFQCL